MRGQRRSVARDQGIAGRHPDLARRPHVQLQHARQHQGARATASTPSSRPTSPVSAATRATSASTGDARYYYELFEDIVGIARVQGGHIVALGDDDLRIVDHFFLGPSLVRGFASSGIGPRDISSLDSRSNAIGGTTYFGGSLEVQFPIFGLPRELGLKGAVFADAGTLFGYKGATTFDVNGNTIIEGFSPTAGCTLVARTTTQECIVVRDSKDIRSSVGASLLWSSPLGPIRFDYAFALTKDEGVIVNGVNDRRRPDPGLPLLGRHPLLTRRAPLGGALDPRFDGRTRFLSAEPGRLPCVRWRRWRRRALPERRRRRARRSAASRRSRVPARPISPTWTTRPTREPSAATRAGACLVSPRFAAKVPAGTVGDRHARSPTGSSPQVLALLFPRRDAARNPRSAPAGVSPGSFVHPTARLEHGVTVDPGRRDRPRRRDRRRDGRRRAGRRSARRSGSAGTARIGAERHDLPRPDRQPRDPPSGRPHRAGRLRLRHGPAGPPQGAADRPRHHPGRRRDRRQHDDRPRRQPRHGDRRGHQDRQPGADRPQRGDRPALRHRRAGRHLRARRRSRISSRSAARSASRATCGSATGAQIAATSGVNGDVPPGARWGGIAGAAGAGVVPRDGRAEKACIARRSRQRRRRRPQDERGARRAVPGGERR